MKDMSGQSQGYGYVEFTSMPDASKAMQQWDGQEVVGQKLSVKVATMGPGQGGTVALPQLDLDDDEGNLHAEESWATVCVHSNSAPAVSV